jgi:hypothetical protein
MLDDAALKDLLEKTAEAAAARQMESPFPVFSFAFAGATGAFHLKLELGRQNHVTEESLV